MFQSTTADVEVGITDWVNQIGNGARVLICDSNGPIAEIRPYYPAARSVIGDWDEDFLD